MSHATGKLIHVYAKRGVDIRISIKTSQAHTAFTAITFRVGAALIQRTGLTATDTAAGFDVDLTLTAAELNLAPSVYTYELIATFGGEVRTFAAGPFRVDAEATTPT